VREFNKLMTTIGINTYAYAWTTPAIDCVRRLADIGYRSFELLVHPPHLSLEDFVQASRRRLAALLSEIGAINCTMNLPSLDHNMASPWPQVRAASVAMFEQTLDLASDLNIPWLVTVPGRMSPLAPASLTNRTNWTRECIEKLLPHARNRGVRLAIENVPMASFPDAASLGAFVRSFGSSDVAICYDAANAHFIGESPAEGIRQLADQLRIVHVSDTTRTVWRHDPVGTGTVPFAEVAKALGEIGFIGPTMMEIIADDPEAALIRSHDILASAGFPSRSGAVAS
jgi:sugar phosphate isomerase/epimerase